MSIDFELESDSGELIKLSQYTNVVLYFYPKDDTPSCTTEARDFSDLSDQFDALGYKILGISTNSIDSHVKFKAKYKFGITLLSDSEHEISHKFGVWVEKSMFGKKYMGIERSTFVMHQCEIIQEWRKVKVTGHANAVLEYLKNRT